MAKPNMKDVARAANVSPMTVSRAFKQSATVSDATRERIMKIAEEMGYVFDSTASNLRSQKTGFIAVIVPTINNANFADTVRAMSEGLRTQDLQILLGYTDYDIQEEERLIEQLLQRRPEAITLTGGKHTPRARRLLLNAGIPVVETWDLPPDPIGHAVGFSNAAAGRLMLEHFVARGYRRIGFIGGDESRDSRGLERRYGFIRALAEHGLDTTRLVASGPPPISMHEGAMSMRELLEKWPDTEAVMCVSDLSAFGALTECQRRGIDVPGQIAIGGFGAYDIAEHCVPALTTIDANAAEIGRQTAKVLLEHRHAMAGKKPFEFPQRIIQLTPTLLPRETT
ncbi:LacI family DNA-binding transcriptional regulator [Halomonas sp. M5N1S17]|uniref:LacI family DNA-binding transcriptional regulator n=1 Tax=Halomonas alkalisoli TaxID=2907158 RepID=UPI001F32FDED|nr:LacI family DNA-binding transcriptional regulator [Halomonas alkalisoli]MCE9664876.1 LacI family DNA-binding transcriptional regulator [Halomonas alkalisoli]